MNKKNYLWISKLMLGIYLIPALIWGAPPKDPPIPPTPPRPGAGTPVNNPKPGVGASATSPKGGSQTAPKGGINAPNTLKGGLGSLPTDVNGIKGHLMDLIRAQEATAKGNPSLPVKPKPLSPDDLAKAIPTPLNPFYYEILDFWEDNGVIHAIINYPYYPFEGPKQFEVAIIDGKPSITIPHPLPESATNVDDIRIFPPLTPDTYEAAYRLAAARFFEADNFSNQARPSFFTPLYYEDDVMAPPIPLWSPRGVLDRVDGNENITVDNPIGGVRRDGNNNATVDKPIGNPGNSGMIEDPSPIGDLIKSIHWDEKGNLIIDD